MGWRFRKSFSPLPGVRINFSPRGISTSVGVGPARIYLGSQGPALTARVPGTGISFRQSIRPSPEANLFPATRSPTPAPLGEVPPTSTVATQLAGEIRSGSTAVLTTDGLQPLKELLTKAQAERSSLLPELAASRNDADRASDRYRRWKEGWLLRRFFKKRFADIEHRSEEAAAKVAELEEQERLSKLSTEFDLPDSLKDGFGRVCDATATLAQSQRVWDTLSSVATDRFRERTTALQSINRQPVTVGFGSSDLIRTPWDVPHLRNANGGDLFIYPGFVLYVISSHAFALIDAKEVTIAFSPVSFIEEEGVPRDAEVIGQTWKKANKDGSPDKRFVNNYQIPIVRYGSLRFSSKTGLNEEYLISNAAVAARYAAEWIGFQKALSKVAT
ncbi:MAG: DUF4236 domain-containing protein [Gemmatimonadaceae bacterium]